MSKISFVYFDVGGVAIKDFSDTNKWSIMLEQAMNIPHESIADFDRLYNEKEDDICLGKVAVDDLQPQIKDNFNAEIPADFSMLNYFVDHFEKNDVLWKLIDKHLKLTKIGLLTDQYPGMLDLIFKKELIPHLPFSAVIDSSVVKVRKPMSQIYELAAQKTGVKDEEILFIDNREKNLVPARKRGWQTFLYDSSNYDLANEQLAKFFSQNL